MFRTINSKFIFFTIIFIMMSVGLPTTFLIRQFRENFEQRTSALLETTMEVVYSDVENVMLKYEHQRVQDIIDKIMRYQIIRHLRFVDPDGNIRFATDTTEIGKNINEVEEGHMDINPADHKVIMLLENKKVYTSTRPIRNLPECQSCHGSAPVIGYLDVDVHLTRAERYFYTGSIHIIFLAIAVILLLFLGFYLLFNRFIRKPLDRLQTALNKVDEGELDTRLPAKKADEIGIVEGQFNTMVANLQASKQQIEELHFEQLQRADKLVTLGELAAEMAHEINNPAAIVMSRADYLQIKADENEPLQKHREDLQVIMNQISKISRITGNILKYSKKLPKKFSALDLRQSIEESLNVLEPRLSVKKIVPHKEFGGENFRISGDAQQMDQVFTNLINNAIDAMPVGGILSLSLNYNDRNQIQFKISDNGNGIPPELLDQIYTPFYTTKPPEQGTGLGLYIVRNICKNHNAEINCTSQPGRGTTFTITFRGNEPKK